MYLCCSRLLEQLKPESLKEPTGAQICAVISARRKARLSTSALRQALDVLDVERLARREELGRAQIHNLQVVAVIHQHVVRLQVQVDHPASVKVVHGTQDLDQQLCNMSLGVEVSDRTDAGLM